MTEIERLQKLNAMLECNERFYAGDKDAPHFSINPEMFKPIAKQDAPSQDLSDSVMNPCPDAGGGKQPQIKAVEVIAAVSILANRGALKLFKKTLEELKAVSGVTIGHGELLSLAAVGCESKDDVALVNAVAGALKAEA